MNRKSKLFFSLVSLCFSVAILCFGVYSALQVTYSVTGSVSYEIQDVFVDIETSLYMSTQDLLTAKQNVSENITALEKDLVDNTTLSQTYKTSYSDTHSTYNNGNVDARDNIHFDNSGNEISVVFGEYMQDKSAYSHFVVIKITNYAETAIGASIDLDIQNLNTLTMNNSLSKNIAGAQTSPTVHYFIISMTLDDATLSVSGNFAIDVCITKDPIEVTTLLVNDTSGTMVDSFEGISYSTKSITLGEPSLFLTDDSNTYFAYNLELTNIPEGINSFNFDLSLTDVDSMSLAYIGILSGNYSDIQSLYVAGDNALNKQDGSLLGLVEDLTGFGQAFADTYDITPFNHRTYGMYVGEYSKNLQFCLFGWLSQTIVSSISQATLTFSLTDKIEKEIYYLRDDGTYAYGINALMAYNSKYFESQGSPTTITMPEQYNGKDVSRVYYMAFFNKSNLENFIFHDGVTYFEPWIFAGCSSLRYTTLPKNITEIPDDMFSGCDITNIEIPENVTRIGIEAFLGCVNLSSITIPSKVGEIGGIAFSNCTTLNTIYLDSEYVVSLSTESIEKGYGGYLFSNLQSGTGKIYVLQSLEITIGDYISSTTNFTRGGTITHDNKTYIEFTKV